MPLIVPLGVRDMKRLRIPTAVATVVVVIILVLGWMLMPRSYRKIGSSCLVVGGYLQSESGIVARVVFTNSWSGAVHYFSDGRVVGMHVTALSGQGESNYDTVDGNAGLFVLGYGQTKPFMLDLPNDTVSWRASVTVYEPSIQQRVRLRCTDVGLYRLLGYGAVSRLTSWLPMRLGQEWKVNSGTLMVPESLRGQRPNPTAEATQPRLDVSYEQ